MQLHEGFSSGLRLLVFTVITCVQPWYTLPRRSWPQKVKEKLVLDRPIRTVAGLPACAGVHWYMINASTRAVKGVVSYTAAIKIAILHHIPLFHVTPSSGPAPLTLSVTVNALDERNTTQQGQARCSLGPRMLTKPSALVVHWLAAAMSSRSLDARVCPTRLVWVSTNTERALKSASFTEVQLYLQGSVFKSDPSD